MATPKMTAVEFAAARRRLGWTPLATAVEYNVTPKVIEAFENGSAKVPNKIAANIRFRTALEEQKAVMDASGLPECAVLEELYRATARNTDEDDTAFTKVVIEHAKDCPICQERRAYLERYAPPIPDIPESPFFRVFGMVFSLPDKLPAPIRPPKDERGEARHIAVGVAAFLSMLACGIVLLVAIAALTRQGWRSDWWKIFGALGLIVPAYFVGFYLAGWSWDALRPIRHRFIGYVLRWGLAGTAIYGTIALIMPFFTDEPLTLKESLGMTAVLGGLWALVGAGVWVKDRLWGKLAKR